LKHDEQAAPVAVEVAATAEQASTNVANAAPQTMQTAASAVQGEPASDVVSASGVASAPAPELARASPAASDVQPASAAVASAPEQSQGTPAVNHPKILFAGDSMMQGVAPMVISRMRKEFPDGDFVDLSRQSTGLTVNRYFDWPAKIRDESIRQNFKTVVIFLGPNDPWDIYEARRRYVFPSENWEKKYRERVDEVLDFAASRGMRIIWIGLPVMREERIKLGAMIENRIFQEETQKHKFDYLSTEEFLGALDKPYKKYIEDPKRGKLVVRADDGVHFTTLGLRMISSRVEELLRKQEKL